MASVKLTETMRTHIAKAMVERRFKKTEAEKRQHRAALALRVVDELMLTPQDKLLIPSLPRGYLPVRSSVAVQWRKNQKCAYRREVFSLPEKVDRVVPYDKSLSVLVVDLEDPNVHPLLREILAVDAEIGAIAEQRRELEQRIVLVLRPATTTLRAKELWPEAAPFISKVEDSYAPVKAMPLTVVPEDLNEKLGLPV